MKSVFFLSFKVTSIGRTLDPKPQPTSTWRPLSPEPRVSRVLLWIALTWALAMYAMFTSLVERLTKGSTVGVLGFWGLGKLARALQPLLKNKKGGWCLLSQATLRPATKKNTDPPVCVEGLRHRCKTHLALYNPRRILESKIIPALQQRALQ